MGILDLFKKKKQQLIMHRSDLKNICKDKSDIYVGKICKIIADINKNNEEIYYLETYEGKKIGNFRDIDFEYCSKYSYAAIYSITDKAVSVCIICNNIYPLSLKIDINSEFESGTVLKINKDSSLLDIESMKNVGRIIDERFNTLDLENIALSQIDNDKLLVLMYK